jgi:hypothetical protein
MTTPAKVKRNLMCARFAFPAIRDWSASTDDQVFSRLRGPDGAELSFSLDNLRDHEKVLFKLREHGWTIKTVKRSGQEYHRAEHRDGTWAEMPSLDALLVDVIERIQGEG